jgi:tetratricopeptide (TPR) repeat protein
VSGINVAACGPGTGVSQVERLLRQGREAFVAGDYRNANELFRSAAAEDPDSAEAAFGVARSLYALHDFDAARSRYEEALRLAPGDALIWRGYAEALYGGGVHEGNGERLGKLLEVAPTAISVAPDSVDIYEHVLRAAAELGRLDAYPVLLEAVAEELPHASVLRVELTKARVEQAQRTRNAAAGTPEYAPLSDEVEEIEASLRADLEAVSGGRPAAPGNPPAVAYGMAAGYELLGEPELTKQWLDVLDLTPEGRRLAASMRYDQFLREWVSTYDLDPSSRVALAERWLPRFTPDWVSGGDRYRAIRGMQFDVMASAARAAIAAADSSVAASGAPGEQPLSEEDADRLALVGRELARTDTQGGAMRLVETTGILARIPSHYVTAVRLADEGIEALSAGVPGLLHPSTPVRERERIARSYVAILKQLQGQALHNLGREEEAERVLREAIAADPSPVGYAVLGGLMLDQGRAAEALDLFVDALAHGFTAGQVALEEQTRASALEAASRVGSGPDDLELAVANAAASVAEDRRLGILADPLDMPAPDFELTDTRGGTWRLSDLVGDVVVLNYWATWCGPCIAELPYFQELVDEYSEVEDVVFLAISTDADPGVVPPFLAANAYTFNTLMDDGSAARFGVTGVPASLLIGKNGRIEYRTSGFPGPQRYLREMRVRIEALRSAPQPR